MTTKIKADTQSWWQQHRAEYNARIIATEIAIKKAIHKMGFRPNTKYANRDCYDCGCLRVAFDHDDERCELYVFAGVPGHAALAYEIGLSYAAPAAVSIATIEAAAKAAKQQK